jgi:hypothetical protein
MSPSSLVLRAHLRLAFVSLVHQDSLFSVCFRTIFHSSLASRFSYRMDRPRVVLAANLGPSSRIWVYDTSFTKARRLIIGLPL